jgi:hypothetical protein
MMDLAEIDIATARMVAGIFLIALPVGWMLLTHTVFKP